VEKPQVVLDTNVLVSALRSRRGASYRLLRLVDAGKFEVNVSVALILEYEEVGKWLCGEIGLTEKDIDDVLNYLCSISNHRAISFMWRPVLQDPDDDMLLELAVAAGNCCIVTFNKSDFRGAEQFGVRILTPKEFLNEIKELP
jgi:putative PIN family toxin of toxin-antitoxin system